MKSFLLGLAVGAVALVYLSPDALAHGGQFRGPGGAVPPGLREPTDPTPPPPPPPTSAPPTTTPSDPAQPPPPTTPSQPPAPAPPTTLPDNPQAPAKRPSQPSFDQWVFWWNNNNDDILNLKAAIYGLRGTFASGLGQLGDTRGNKTDATRPTEKQVKDVLIPALLWAMDHKNNLHPDVESAAYIALAKVTDDPAHFKKIMEGVYKDGQPNKEVDQIVRESAALSLGLIRRADPTRQFVAKDLDQVREFLFTAFEDDALATQTRAFAALSLGLLGDQPTAQGTTSAGGGGLFYAPDASSTSLATTTGRLWALLHKEYKDEDLPVCLMLALSLQKPETVTQDMVTELRDCALRGKFNKAEVKDTLASYAALAVGRLGSTKDDIAGMVQAMTIHQTGLNTKRSAAIALGQLGKRVDGADRADVVSKLWKGYNEVKEDSTRNFAIMSMAYVLCKDVEAQRTDVLQAKGVKVADELLKIAQEGNYRQRPYGALAIGLVSAKIGDKTEIQEYATFRGRAVAILLEGVEDLKLDKRGRAAFAIGLGLVQEPSAIRKLLPILQNREEDKELRGYAAVALGMIGTTNAEVVKALSEALKERSSEELRQQTAIGLGLLQSPTTVPFLLKELEEAESANIAGQIVLALAKIGDATTIKPLVDILKPEAGKTPKPDITRALACAGLGLIGDLEMIPSLSRLSKDINYRASPPAIREVLTIL